MNAGIFAGTLGFKVGNRWGLMAEASYGASTLSSYGNTLQYNAGFFFKL